MAVGELDHELPAVDQRIDGAQVDSEVVRFVEPLPVRRIDLAELSRTPPQPQRMENDRRTVDIEHDATVMNPCRWLHDGCAGGPHQR